MEPFIGWAGWPLVAFLSAIIALVMAWLCKKKKPANGSAMPIFSGTVFDNTKTKGAGCSYEAPGTVPAGDPHDSPITSATVKVTATDSARSYTDSPDADGRYSIKVAAGTYDILVTPGAGSPQTICPGTTNPREGITVVSGQKYVEDFGFE